MCACAGSNHTDGFLREEELSEASLAVLSTWSLADLYNYSQAISIQSSKEPHKKPMSKEAQKKFHDDYLW